MATEITNQTARQYLLQHVGALRHQLPFGDPFVFLGAFSLISVMAHATGGKYEVRKVVNTFFPEGYSKAADLIEGSSERFFQQFTLQPAYYGEVKEDSVGVYKSSAPTYFVYTDEAKQVPVTKLNLSHKDRDHLKAKNGKLTLSASAFLDDLESAINKLFDSLDTDPLLAAKIYVYFNENPLIGYGD